MTHAIDLDAYLARIGHTGSREPTLETLRALHLEHACSIAFENLNPYSGQPVLLDPAALESKLVRAGRGGYCFEQNLLFTHALRALGFAVSGLAARVMWNVPEGNVTMRSHMLLRIEIGAESYVADVGFGGQTLTGPLRLQPDIEQATPHEPFRLLREAGDFTLQSKVAGLWKSLYRFDLQVQFQQDYEPINYYLATHPDSRFRKLLVAALPAHGKRFALLNNRLTVHHLNGPSEPRILTSVTEIRRVLEESFRLELPKGTDLDGALNRALADEPTR